MSSAAREYCERCNGPLGSCLCTSSHEDRISDVLGRSPFSRERDELERLVGLRVLVAGRWAYIRREDGAYVVTFEHGHMPPFRARGTAGAVLRMAEDHVLAVER
jgi:hypothetical protein